MKKHLFNKNNINNATHFKGPKNCTVHRKTPNEPFCKMLFYCYLHSAAVLLNITLNVVIALFGHKLWILIGTSLILDLHCCTLSNMNYFAQIFYIFSALKELNMCKHFAPLGFWSSAAPSCWITRQVERQSCEAPFLLDMMMKLCRGVHYTAVEEVGPTWDHRGRPSSLCCVVDTRHIVLSQESH